MVGHTDQPRNTNTHFRQADWWLDTQTSPGTQTHILDRQIDGWTHIPAQEHKHILDRQIDVWTHRPAQEHKHTF